VPKTKDLGGEARRDAQKESFRDTLECSGYEVDVKRRKPRSKQGDVQREAKTEAAHRESGRGHERKGWNHRGRGKSAIGKRLLEERNIH